MVCVWVDAWRLGKSGFLSLLASLGVALGSLGVPAMAKESPAGASVAQTVTLASLPPQARKTHELIVSGGPFPYDKDGTVFGNRERQLPRQARGYYREYTVKTPGSRDRGARRIVCGGLKPVQPEQCFYTADHYANFSRIVQ